jgi:flagellar FliJ protein
MEAPFRFGLQRVRDLRAHDEDQAKERFAHSLNARIKGEAMLRAAEERLHDAQQGPVPSTLSQPVTGASLVSRQMWVEQLKARRDDAAFNLRGLEVQLQESRDSLTEASQRREALDQLKERQRDAHRRAAARREGAELDEMALQMHARRRAA